MGNDSPAQTTFFSAWKNEKRPQFLTGVSLHGHTWHSHESLSFLSGAVKKTYILPYLMRRLEKHYKAKWKKELDYSRGYWTSPVSPDAAYALERKQIEAYGLSPLVSITDHDEVAACKDIVSLEWTAPYRNAVFHIGVHNLPREHAAKIVNDIHAITAAGSQDANALTDVLAAIARFPEAIIILNHPLVDQGRLGHAMHKERVQDFLEHHRELIHALEINALQPKAVNERVVAIGRAFALPLISGGDRHGFEPNGAINLTNARTFGEFAREIREEKKSVLLYMPQYRERLAFRYSRNIETIMAEYPGLEGRRFWHDRVFYHCPDGVTRSLSELSGSRSRVITTTNRIVKVLSAVNTLTTPI